MSDAFVIFHYIISFFLRIVELLYCKAIYQFLSGKLAIEVFVHFFEHLFHVGSFFSVDKMCCDECQCCLLHLQLATEV